MNTIVNGMRRKDLFLDIIKKNAYSCSLDKIAVQYALSSKKNLEWVIKAKYKLSVLHLTGEIANIDFSLHVSSPQGMDALFLEVDSEWVMKEYGITAEKIHRIVSTFPTRLMLRGKDIRVIESIYSAHIL